MNAKAHTQSTLAMMLGLAVPALTLTRRNRGRIHRCLMELTSPKGTAEQEAAAVAALLGGGSASTALALGQELFRSLPLSALTEADLGTSKNTGLHEKTIRATLGEVDAFMSHSWSDPGDVKFAALNDWGTRFSEQGRDASIWLGEYSRNPTRVLERKKERILDPRAEQDMSATHTAPKKSNVKQTTRDRAIHHATHA